MAPLSALLKSAPHRSSLSDSASERLELDASRLALKRVANFHCKLFYRERLLQ